VPPGESIRFRWFWPYGARSALALTHDVESEAGLRNALHIAELEAERGFRSSFNVVKSWYPIDHGVLRELAPVVEAFAEHADRNDKLAQALMLRHGIPRDMVTALAAKYTRPQDQQFLPDHDPDFDVVWAIRPLSAMAWRLDDYDASQRRWSPLW